MPRGRIIPVEDMNYVELSSRLQREWEHPDSTAAEPVVIETGNSLRPQQTPTHLYVIWTAWRDLPPRRRSEMIMDVYEAVRGRAYALNVTLALGLTPEEAKQMGIKYETEAAA